MDDTQAHLFSLWVIWHVNKLTWQLFRLICPMILSVKQPHLKWDGSTLLWAKIINWTEQIGRTNHMVLTHKMWLKSLNIWLKHDIKFYSESTLNFVPQAPPMSGISVRTLIYHVSHGSFSEIKQKSISKCFSKVCELMAPVYHRVAYQNYLIATDKGLCWVFA